MVRSKVVNASNRLSWFLICALATIGSASPVLARPARLHLKSAPVELVRDKNGNPVASIDGELLSDNWSGYVLSSAYTKQNYKSASATWVVPEVTYDGIQSISANWIGIGGFCKSKIKHERCKPDKTLIQMGTYQAAYSDDDIEYYAWYEKIPASSVPIEAIDVSPGDTITASLSCSGKCKNPQQWTLSIEDVTNSQSWSQVFTYQSSKRSVDFIEEAPSSGGGILPLADFDKTFFSASVANGDSVNLDDAIGLEMEDPQGQFSSISPPDMSKDGFAACFSDSGLVDCTDP